MRDPQMLIIGDLHLRDDVPGYLESQCKFIEDTIKQAAIHDTYDQLEVMLLGDVFDKRNPSVKVMLALKNLLDKITSWGYAVYIIEGNHDAVSKADDGVTALSLFDGVGVKVFNYFHNDEDNKYFHNDEDNKGTKAIIPHYENEETIKKHLASIKYKRTTVFGHFGYHGSLNSAGDNDFRIPLECFNNLTFLGHIHHYSATDKVVVVGTPYTTSFQEAGKPNYVVYYKHNGRKASWEAVPAVGGPRHHVCKIEDLHKLNLEKENFNLVRVMMNPLKEVSDLDIMSQIKTNYPLINWVDLRFNTITDTKVEQSYYRPDRQLFTINEAIIEDYIDSSPTQLTKADLLAGLKELNEDQ